MVNPVLNGIDTFLNFLTWYAMKNLSGEVGANGLAVSVLAVQRRRRGCPVSIWWAIAWVEG